MRTLLPVLFGALLLSCKNKNPEKTHLPSNEYTYVKVDASMLVEQHSVYVPVYSHIYAHSGTSYVSLNTTLSIRNTAFRDSFYVTEVVYYGSQGQVLKNYLPQPVLVKPMASIEFVVERDESKGGAGANFVVKWGARHAGSEPLIQALMNETTTGISFLANGVEIK